MMGKQWVVAWSIEVKRLANPILPRPVQAVVRVCIPEDPSERALACGLHMGRIKPRSVGRAFADNGHAHRGQGQCGELEVLHAKGAADDGDAAPEGCDEVPNGQPDTDDQKPDHIANQSQGSCAQILHTVNFSATDCLFAKGQERKLPDDKAGPRLG